MTAHITNGIQTNDARENIIGIASVEEINGRLRSIRDPKTTNDDLMNVYDRWAQDYNKEVDKVLYVGPNRLAKFMKNVVKQTNSKILDIGAGTGLFGIELQRVGYTDVDAVEPSEAMAHEARQLGVYQRMIVDFVTSQPLDVQDGTYDVVAGSGVFIPGHLKPEAFDEFIRITKKGGLIFIMCSQKYYKEDYGFYGLSLDTRMQELVDAQKWQQVERTVIQYHDDGNNANLTVLKKL